VIFRDPDRNMIFRVALEINLSNIVRALVRPKNYGLTNSQCMLEDAR